MREQVKVDRVPKKVDYMLNRLNSVGEQAYSSENNHIA
jgi:uncharacterized coiled-coil protein SlyX